LDNGIESVLRGRHSHDRLFLRPVWYMRDGHCQLSGPKAPFSCPARLERGSIIGEQGSSPTRAAAPPTRRAYRPPKLTMPPQPLNDLVLRRAVPDGLIRRGRIVRGGRRVGRNWRLIVAVGGIIRIVVRVRRRAKRQATKPDPHRGTGAEMFLYLVSCRSRGASVKAA
jgi:hypothetical protein